MAFAPIFVGLTFWNQFINCLPIAFEFSFNHVFPALRLWIINRLPTGGWKTAKALPNILRRLRISLERHH